MKKINIGIMLIGCFILSFNIFMFAQLGYAEETIKVMTFNLRFGTAPDGPNHWNNRKDMVIEVIKNYDPDLLGTQECLDFQTK